MSGLKPKLEKFKLRAILAQAARAFSKTPQNIQRVAKGKVRKS